MKFNFKKARALALCGVLLVTSLQATNTSRAAEVSPKVSVTTNIANGVSQSYIIEGNSQSSLSLDDLQLRYYYSKSDNKAQTFNCDNAGLGLNVAPYYVDLTKSVKGTFKNNYLEISFNDAGNLGNGKLNLGVRFNNSDWSAYSNFKEVKLEVVYDGKVVSTKKFGDDVEEPTVAPTKEPTVAPTETPTKVPTVAPTEVPTVAPTEVPTVAPTTQPVVSSSVKDGWYMIKGVGSQKYLQVENNNGTAGANVNIGNKSGVAGQIWKVTNTNDGYVTLTSKLGDFMIDIAYGKDENNANVGIYNAYSGDAQKFQLKNVRDNIFTINTKVSNGSKVLDVASRSTANGANVAQYTSNGQTNQQWIFEAVDGSAQPATQEPATQQPTQEASGCILPKCDVDKDGPFQVTVQTGVGPNGKGWLVRPTNLGTNGMTKHPVFIWGPGGGDNPSLYQGFMKRWASMGFIVYSEESQWSGAQAPAALDWICKQATTRGSVLYGRVDTTRMAAGGFSLGSVGAYAVASDSRIVTTIHCDGGSFDGLGHTKWRHPTCVMNGLNDGGLAMGNTDRDYNAATVPIWYGGIIGGGHGSTVWDGGDAIAGWLRWQVGGDTSCRDMFLTPQGRFNNGKFKSRWKNWN